MGILLHYTITAAGQQPGRGGDGGQTGGGGKGEREGVGEAAGPSQEEYGHSSHTASSLRGGVCVCV